jgi:hypothetical protein
MPPEIKPKTQLAFLIHDRMKERGMSVHELKDATAVCYERARTAVTGDSPPGERLLRDICRVLQLDFAAANEMLITEQMKRKFGRVPALKKHDPELQSIEEAWPSLLPDEKEHIVLLVERYVRKQRQQFVAPVPRILPRPVRKP